MNRQHFEAFAAVARRRRQDAQRCEAEGRKEEATAATFVALGIEEAVIEVAQQFNPSFDPARFRRACCADDIQQVLGDIMDARKKADERLSGKRASRS